MPQLWKSSGSWTDMPLLNNIPVSLPMKEVLARLQFKRGITLVDKNIESLLEELGRESLSLIEPKAVYETFCLLILTKDTLLVGTDLKVKSATLVQHLDSYGSCTLMACTIGEHLGNRTRVYEEKGDLLRATILDAYGSELADAVADHVNKIIRWEADRKTASLTMRYSPGYGDFPLSTQPLILKMLEADRIGLSADAHHILHPEKSITAVIGMKAGQAPVCPNCG